MIRLRTGFIDGQRSAFNVLTVEGGNRFYGFSVVTHVNEPKPFGLSRVTVSHNADSLNCSVGFKKRTENRFRDGNTQVSNKYAFHILKVFPIVVNGHPFPASIERIELRYPKCPTIRLLSTIGRGDQSPKISPGDTVFRE